MAPISWIIRADASAELGVGHLARCMAFAKQALDNQVAVKVIASQITSFMYDMISKTGAQIIENPFERGSLDDADFTAKYANQECRLLLLDGYCFDYEYQTRCRGRSENFVVLDDYLTPRRFSCDLVVNPNAHASEEMYANRLSPETKLALGPTYVFIASALKELFASKGADVCRRKPEDLRVFMCLGGGDQTDRFMTLVSALESEKLPSLKVHLVYGDSKEKILREAVLSSSHEFKFSKWLDKSLPREMSRSDCVIVAGGTMLWEACYLGIPALATSVASNQTANLVELARRGAVVNLGNGVDKVSFKDRLYEALIDSNKRAELSRVARNMVDGQGAQRVISHLKNPVFTDN